MKGVAGFSGERLTQAREARGHTKKSLSDSVEISTTALADLENGKHLPREDTLARFVEVLAFPRGFFVRPAPKLSVGPVFWRKQAAEALRSQSRTEQRIRWAAEAFSVLEEMVSFGPLNLPDRSWLPHHWSAISDEQIERLAEQCRDEWGLGMHPIPDMTLALENIGIPVLCFDIESTKQYGYTDWIPEIGRPIVGVNSFECSWARQRFNLAHEFGHVLMHVKSASPAELRSPAIYKQIEDQAHRFAGALLFPRDAFVKEVGYVNLETFSALKQERGISIMAQITRAKQLGLCTADWAQGLFQQASKRGFRRPFGEPFDNAHELERPRMLRRAIDAIEDGSELLLSRLDASLQLPRTEAVALFGRSLSPSKANVFQLRPGR
ncbi:XRE family transcriptional regulator [Rhodobacter maris]|uniref:Zn-dependent peptidase ImmA (M78 family) n=1 Tax=Rhodobacter maris TaxID=446682 RepID=A0A285TFX2_9RHOB|nr:XRE family transcriptional regulator [Rhodobacter maris]SOC20638.1 Zn-dependent peptidase ImmA (M78 family) [Rhodobacter maris]